MKQSLWLTFACITMFLSGSGALAGSLFQQPALRAPANDNQLEFVSQLRIEVKDGKKIIEYLVPHTQDTWKFLAEIENYPAGTQLHHWGPKRDISYWAQNGIDQEDIRKAVSRYNDVDAYGGGFYVSLHPVDSAGYGTNLLIAETEKPMTVLAFSQFDTNTLRWVKESQAFMTLDRMFLVPTALLAEFGIDAVKYTHSWMVCIRANPLHHLFEANWDNFSKRYGGSKFDIETFFSFARRYPPAPSDWQTKSFQQAFPGIYKYLNGETLSELDVQPILEGIIAKSTSVSPPSLWLLTVEEPWLDFWERSKPAMRSPLRLQAQKLKAVNGYPAAYEMLKSILRPIGIDTEELLRDQAISTPQQFVHDAPRFCRAVYK